MSIVNGKTEDHLDMLDNMVIERLLNDKWSAFARVILANLHSNPSIDILISGELCSSISVTLFTFIVPHNCYLSTQSEK